MSRPACDYFDCSQPASVVDDTSDPDRRLHVCALHALELRVETALLADEIWPRQLAEKVCTRLGFGPTVRDLLIGTAGVAA